MKVALNKLLVLMTAGALLTVGCTSAVSGDSSDQPDPAAGDEEPASTIRIDSSADENESGNDGNDGDEEPPDEPVSIEVQQANAIESVLVTYVDAINDRRGADAYALFTDALRKRIDLDELIEGTATSVISRLTVTNVEFDPIGSAVVYANFRTDQASEFGREGQTCSLWELEYQMVNVSSTTGGGTTNGAAGDWRIDRATPLGGSPFACPTVVVDDPDQKPIVRQQGERAIVHLTLDDGPGPETTRFLQLFREFGVEATFFVNSNRIAGRETIVQEIVSDGHAIANHTHTHCNIQNPNRLTPSELCSGRTAADEIADAQTIIEATTGQLPTCFRPPYGAQSAATKEVVAGFGLRSWLWDIDTNDWKFNAKNADYSDAQALAELSKTATLRPSFGSEGVIVLLHDGTASAPRMLGLLRSWLEANRDDYDFRVLTGCR